MDANFDFHHSLFNLHSSLNPAPVFEMEAIAGFATNRACFVTTMIVAIQTCLREAEILASHSEDLESVANDVKALYKGRLTSLLMSLDRPDFVWAAGSPRPSRGGKFYETLD